MPSSSGFRVLHSILNTKAEGSLKMTALIYHTTNNHVPQASNLHSHYYEEAKAKLILDLKMEKVVLTLGGTGGVKLDR